MDAIEFVQQLRRMDKSVIRKYSVFDDSPEDVVAEVEEWAKMNPVKTRQSVFLEQFPSARIDSQAVIYVCPADAYGDKVCPKNEENAHMPCRDCRRNFWSQEAE